MKTVQKKNEIKRVKDMEAESLVRFHGYKYVPKSTLKPEKVKEKSQTPAEEEPVVTEKRGKGKK